VLKKYRIYMQIELTANGVAASVGGVRHFDGQSDPGKAAMIWSHRNAVVLTLVICALSSQSVLAKKHHSSHKPSTKTSGGTLSLGTNTYQGSVTVSSGVFLIAPAPYESLIINSGYQGLFTNTAGTLTLADSYQGSTTLSTGTLTIGNTLNLAGSGTTVSNIAPLVFVDSSELKFAELVNSSSYTGTLQINNVANYSAGSITLSANSNVVIPSDGIVLSSGTLSVTTPEPSSLGLVAFATLAFLRRPSRK
jgi:hypothetical protein